MALAQDLYQRLLAWLLEHINLFLRPRTKPSSQVKSNQGTKLSTTAPRPHDKRRSVSLLDASGLAGSYPDPHPSVSASALPTEVRGLDACHPHPRSHPSPSPSPSPSPFTLTLDPHPPHLSPLTSHLSPSPSPLTYHLSPITSHPHPHPHQARGLDALLSRLLVDGITARLVGSSVPGLFEAHEACEILLRGTQGGGDEAAVRSAASAASEEICRRLPHAHAAANGTNAPNGATAVDSNGANATAAASQVRSSQVRSSQVRSSQVRSSQAGSTGADATTTPPRRFYIPSPPLACWPPPTSTPPHPPSSPSSPPARSSTGDVATYDGAADGAVVGAACRTWLCSDSGHRAIELLG